MAVSLDNIANMKLIFPVFVSVTYARFVFLVEQISLLLVNSPKSNRSQV